METAQTPIKPPITAERVFVGIGKAVKSVPEWHTKQIMSVYDRHFALKPQTMHEQDVADITREKVQRYAKAAGWGATLLEAGIIASLAVVGYRRLRKGNIVKEAPPVRIEIPPSGTIHELEGILHIQEGEEAIHAQVADALRSTHSETPLIHQFDRFLEDAPELFVPHGAGARIVTSQFFNHERDEAVISLTRIEGEGGYLDYVINTLYPSRGKGFKGVARLRRDPGASPLVGYRLSAPLMAHEDGDFFGGHMPSDRFIGKWFKKGEYTAHPIGDMFSLSHIEQRIIDADRNPDIAAKRLRVLETVLKGSAA